MDRLENVATPPTAATVLAPDSVPPPALVPIAMVTLSREPVTVLSKASRTVTCTGGAIATPAPAFAAFPTRRSSDLAAGLMLNAADVAPASGADAAASV